MWKKAVLLGALGYAIGIVIGVVIFLLNSSRSFAEALPYILLSGIPGAIAMGSTVIYEIEKWSISRATFTHFLITFSSIYLVGFALEWFRFGDPVFWLFTATMIAAYILIWLIQYLAYKRQVRKMNEDLQKWKTRKTK
jgi:hypothetical protein